ncbi:Hsp20/alpha crystallin family protein [Halomonas nitroreducens]|uniref:Hsp20/alpha crystallin family protein n=1 Tax=Halomonas nitroreducens TaxID=447425 RepID=A0A431V5Y0_9GAMM|nr:Hsp20/alpha crystallin family protein [Halomonas nitroreducens]RTR05952.1 Hsp20/alpha crystallin family protein [Halomonas nitroreducens]
MARKNVKHISPSESPTPPSPAPSRESQVLSPFREMERMLDRMFEHGWMPSWRREHPLWEHFGALESEFPKVDIIDRDAEVCIRAELPGIERKDLDISVTDDSVTIKGESKQERKEETGEYFRSEISQKSYSRTLSLPCAIDADRAEASFTNGLLELTLPKQKQANRRKVEVK